MKKTVLTFGLISGAILSLVMLGTLPFLDKIGFEKGEVIGYTGMRSMHPQTNTLRCKKRVRTVPR